MKRWISFFLLTYLIVSWPKNAEASDFPVQTVLDACLKEENIELCRSLGLAKNNVEDYGNKKLKQWGMVNFASVVGTMMHVATKRSIEIRDRSQFWPVLGHERIINVNENTVMIQLIWPLEW